MEDNVLGQRGKTLEEEFFRKEEAKLEDMIQNLERLQQQFKAGDSADSGV